MCRRLRAIFSSNTEEEFKCNSRYEQRGDLKERKARTISCCSLRGRWKYLHFSSVLRQCRRGERFPVIFHRLVFL